MSLRSTLAVTAIALLFAHSGARAQLLPSYGLKLGAVGANESWTGLSAGVKTENRWGITADAFTYLPLSGYIGAQVEIQYTQKGVTFSSPVNTALQYNTVSPRIDYISVPLLMRLQVPVGSFIPYVIIGPRFDFLISKDPDGLGATINNFDNMDYGLTAGVGAEFDSLLPFGLVAEFRYNPNAYDSYESATTAVRNRSVDFLVGIRL